MRLARTDGRYLRFGHRGAARLAPENTLASIEAALAAGVDGVEIDVVGWEGRLLVAHAAGERTASSPRLEEALELLARSDVLIDLDVKRPGLEREIVAALRRYALGERVIVSSFYAAALRAFRRLEPSLTLGLAYPFDRTGQAERLIPTPVVQAALTAMRRALPPRIGRMLRKAEADAAMLHHLVVSPALVARCRPRGVPIVVWTVNEEADLARAAALGVDGVISDDPRIFPEV